MFTVKLVSANNTTAIVRVCDVLVTNDYDAMRKAEEYYAGFTAVSCSRS